MALRGLGRPSLILILCASLFLGALTAYADAPATTEPAPLSPTDRAELQKQYDKLFAEMLQRPTDLDLMFS